MVKNIFGVEVESAVDLSEIKANTGYELLPKGVYDLILNDIKFTNSQNGNPMLVFEYKVLANDKESVIKDYKLLVGGVSEKGNEYDAPILSYLAGIFECWEVPKEFRSIKYFNYAGNEELREDPSKTLMKSFKQYASVCKNNTQYVSKLMFRGEIDQKPSNKDETKIFNVLKKFVKIENSIKEQEVNPFDAPF